MQTGVENITSQVLQILFRVSSEYKASTRWLSDSVMALLFEYMQKRSVLIPRMVNMILDGLLFYSLRNSRRVVRDRLPTFFVPYVPRLLPPPKSLGRVSHRLSSKSFTTHGYWPCVYPIARQGSSLMDSEIWMYCSS